MKTWTDLTLEARHVGVLIEDKTFDGSQCGEYDPVSRTAFIDPTMSMEQLVCTLQHELIHAKHFDDGLRLLSREKEECLTRKETALALINPVEYMHAEDLYGGEPYAMAQELGITVGVLLDYQRWLHDYVPYPCFLQSGNTVRGYN